MDISFHCYEIDQFGDGKNKVRSFVYTDYSIKPHNHDFYEINIILRGRGVHCIENASIDVHPGDVFVIPPQTVHAYFDTEGLDVHHILIHRDFVAENRAEADAVPGFIQLMEIEPYLRAHFSDAMFLHLSASELMALRADLDKIADKGEFNREELQPMKRHAVWAILYRLSYLLHLQQADTDKPAKRKNESLILRALEYIHAHYDEKITVDTLCREIYMSRSTFLRSFGVMCGCSPTEYLSAYRRKKAAEMLESGELSKTEVAHMCGYYDLSHMERSLK